MARRSTQRPRLPIVFIYVEGDDILRPSFQIFFADLRQRVLGRYDFRVVMGESNKQTAEDWKLQQSKKNPNDIVLLLIDSEGPVPTPHPPNSVPSGCSSFLKLSDLATNDVYFMVQLMESWYLTNVQALADIYGRNFQANQLPQIPTHPSPPQPGQHLESISKQIILDGLNRATQNTHKGAYLRTNAKTSVAPKMLEKMNLRDIAIVSWHAQQLLDRLNRL